MSQFHVGGAWAALAILVAAVTPAVAACGPNSDALGISRTITIDAEGGKLYGGLQYDSSTLLKDGEVILTFDDGPLRRHTRKVLAALESHCTKATFFMVGRMAVSDPAMVKEVAGAGHTIAHHTWSHKNLQQRNARRAGGEIELGISAVAIAAEKPTSPFFRFPYLADPNSMIAYGKERNLAIFSIDIDSYDYKTRSPEKVFGNIMSQLRSRRKGIMLFHDIQPSTANALQRILDTMKREGFKIVHIVPKAPVTTLANFDAEANKLHDKKRTIATASAIDGGDYEAGGRPHEIRPSVAEETAPPPTLATITKPAPAPSSSPFSFLAPSSNQKTGSQPDWRQQIWGN